MSDDYSANVQTTGAVAVGGTATGNIGSNGDSDWFAVELVAGRTYVIDLRGSPTDDGTLSDPYLRGIHDSDGNLIARTTNDDGGEGYNSRVTFTATESGTHYIAAGAAGIFSGRGTYEVEVTDTSPPIVAPDPDSEDPPVTQEQVQQQPPAFGSQFYGFDLPEDTDGSANRISLGTVSATDPDGGSVTYSIEGGNAAGLFEIDATSGELFYTGGGEDYETGSTSFELTVRASDGDQTTDTTATVSVTDVDEPVEGNPPVAEPDPARAAAEDLGDITELAAARFPRGTLDGGADGVGWYRFTLSEARAVGLGLRRQDADADLVLEDAEGNVLHSSANGGTANEWVRETLLAGTYYVGVEAQEAGANAYVFRYGVGDADPAEVARLEAERTSAQEQEQAPPSAVTVVPPTEPETAQAQDEAASVSEGDTDLPADVTTTGRVVVGGSATGNIGSNGDRDWFAVDLEAGKTYWFDLEGSATDGGTLRDPYLRGIYDANGELIDGTTDDYDGVGNNSRVYFTPAEDATYYVSAGGTRNKTGTYTLTVNETPDDDYAADRTTTGMVVVGGSATGTIEPPGDDWDWFAVELEAGQAYRFDLEGSATGGGTLRDPYLRGIYDSEGRYQSGSYNDDSGVGKNSRVDFAAAEGATYYVMVGGAGEGGTYTLAVTEISDDYAADRTTTGRVVVDGSATGNVEYNRDTDWFAVELEAGQAYRFDLEGSSTGGGTLRDPVLTGIYDSAGRQSVGYHDGGGVDRNSRAYFAPDEGATYYVSAGAFADYQGTYTLRVTDLGPVSVSEGGTDLPANSTTPGRVMVDSSATGNIEYSGYSSGDRDWFAVDLEADKMYRFDLEGSPTGNGTLRDPYLRGIYDANGDRIDGTSDWSSGVGLNSRVFFTPDEGATYYISAGSNRYHIGTYTLTVTDVTGYPDDYAADATTTGTVVVGGSATGDVEYRGDADWFAVTLEAGKAYYFDLKGSPTGDGTLDDPYLRGIYDEEGDRFDRTRSDDTGVGQRNSRALFTPDEDATYYVSAGAYGNYQGTYTLAVSEISDDYAADPATTGTVVPDGSATGDVEYHGDRDWFAVTLEAGKTYRFDLEGALDGGGNLWNPYLRGIYDANGELIDGTADDDSPGVDRSSQVYFRPDEDATYYVSAAGAYRDATGTYTLVVTEISDDYAADPTTTGTVAVGGSAMGNIEPLGDRDWFAVDLEADKAYQFDLQGRPGGGGTLRDTVLRGIYDSEGRYQSGSYNDDFGGSRNSRVLFTPDEDATYYVSAGGYRNYVGTYTLSVEEVDAM